MAKNGDGPERITTEPGQTIIIERRPRRSLLRGAFSVLLVLGLVSTLWVATSSSDLLPSRVEEKYVAGSLLPSTAKVAIVEIKGTISDSMAEQTIKQIHRARDDSHVKAVVLRVDSPGGTVAASDQLWREVEILKRTGKPIVVSMGNMAASGGYYVSAPADYIFAEPTTWTGSIGVIMNVPELKGLLEKIGVKFNPIKTSEWKDSGSMFREMTEAERERWRKVIDQAYQRFVRVVAQGRKLPLSRVRPLADGRVYTSQEAKDLKLVDEIGYLEDAILRAKDAARLRSVRVVRYARPVDWTSMLLGASTHRNAEPFDADQFVAKIQTPQMYFLAQ